jgi:hypothetical protein
MGDVLLEYNYFIFSIDNVHPNIFIVPFYVQITHIRQIAVELRTRQRMEEFFKSTSLMKNLFDLNSLMFNKY